MSDTVHFTVREEPRGDVLLRVGVGVDLLRRAPLAVARHSEAGRSSGHVDRFRRVDEHLPSGLATDHDRCFGAALFADDTHSLRIDPATNHQHITWSRSAWIPRSIVRNGAAAVPAASLSPVVLTTYSGIIHPLNSTQTVLSIDCDACPVDSVTVPRRIKPGRRPDPRTAEAARRR